MAFTVTFTASSSDNYSEGFDFYFMNSKKTWFSCYFVSFFSSYGKMCRVNVRYKYQK